MVFKSVKGVIQQNNTLIKYSNASTKLSYFQLCINSGRGDGIPV